MTDVPIADRARFDRIRYAQLWEDGDVLNAAMGDLAGGEVVSICSAGDNAIGLLLLDPARVHAVDLSPAQLECLYLRIAAYRTLNHEEFLELMGARASARRAELLARTLTGASPETRAFWQALEADVVVHGAAGVGKFETYFRYFSRYLLPLVHSRATIRDIFTPRSPQDRATFFDTRFNTWRWRLLVRLFFSRFMMGRMGRDAAFFDHVEGSVSDHVFRRLRHAGVDTDPSQNPYLHWIMTGTHGDALPVAWRGEHYDTIRARLDRIAPHLGPLEALVVRDVAGFNLSDIFEYMSPEMTETAYGGLLDMARPGARLVYWNMMAPRRVPPVFADRVETLKPLEDQLKARDMAFFYSDFVVEQVL
ncbi:MAG: BtaA family protein [Alphaproteobacteria bacterium]|nr:BtaA family protein [Alphaproteobacteria bacterium]